MHEMSNGEMGVLRTRGMKVLHGARVAEAEPAETPAPRERKATPKPVARPERTDKAGPGGLAGWVMGLMARREGLKEARHLRVLETHALGGRRQLMLVLCDGERFLVGSGSDRVDTIVRIGEAVKAAEAPCL